MQDLAEFTVGPPHPVTDSRLLPVVTADDEGGFVTGADLVDEHPDNEVAIPDGALEGLLTASSPEAEAAAVAAAGEGDAPEATSDELAALVADVDTDDVDGAGFGVEEQGFVGLDALDDAAADDPTADDVDDEDGEQ